MRKSKALPLQKYLIKIPKTLYFDKYAPYHIHFK